MRSTLMRRPVHYNQPAVTCPPQKCPTHGISGPYLIGYTVPWTQTASWSFYTAHLFDQQTDRHTDDATCDICYVWSHTYMRRSLKSIGLENTRLKLIVVCFIVMYYVHAEAKSKATEICPPGYSRPRPALDNYICNVYCTFAQHKTSDHQCRCASMGSLC